MVGLKVGFKSRGVMNDFTIGEIAQISNINASALRYYEQIGLLPKARRIGGRRRYSEDTLKLLQVLRLAQSAGFTLAEIQTLVHGFEPDTPPSLRWKELAGKKLLDIQEQVRGLEQMKAVLHTALNCGCLKLEDCAAIPEEVCRPNQAGSGMG
jgi:MerR family redox-sensitive transcriptional activator SoxR